MIRPNPPRAIRNAISTSSRRGYVETHVFRTASAHPRIIMVRTKISRIGSERMESTSSGQNVTPIIKVPSLFN